MYAVGDPNSTARVTVLNSLICPSDASPNIDEFRMMLKKLGGI